MSQTAKNQLFFLHVIAIFEGLSLLLLFFVAMPLKYIWGMPEYVASIGLAHGILFLVYVAALSASLHLLRWSKGKILWAYLAANVPFGTFTIRYQPDGPKPATPQESPA